MSTLAIDHRIADDQVVWAFGPKMTPVLEVDPGTVVTLAMKDGLNGQITRKDQLVRDILTDLDLTHVNGARGRSRCAAPSPATRSSSTSSRSAPAPTRRRARDPGRRPAAPARARGAHEALRGRRRHDPHERADLVPDPPDARRDGRAPPAGEEVLNGFAGEHGGNLDNHLHGPGSRIYFPVRQPGGMFAAGDMHASMGDGEISGTGVEIAGEVDIRARARQGRAGPLARDRARRPLGRARDLARRPRARRSSWPPRRPRGCSSTSGASRSTRPSSSSRWRATRASRRPASRRRSRPSRACMIPKIAACPQPFAD